MTGVFTAPPGVGLPVDRSRPTLASILLPCSSDRVAGADEIGGFPTILVSLLPQKSLHGSNIDTALPVS